MAPSNPQDDHKVVCVKGPRATKYGCLNNAGLLSLSQKENPLHSAMQIH